MKNKLRLYPLLTLLLSPLALNANIVVDPMFSTGFVGTWSGQNNWGGSNLLNGTGVAASSAFIYNDGWVTFEEAGGSDGWTIVEGEAVRAVNVDRFNGKGFGQMITNPTNGLFDNGDSVAFSFNYQLDAFDANTSNTFLSGSVFGINAPNGTGELWGFDERNLSLGSTPGSSGSTINATPTAGTNYSFHLLNNFTHSGSDSTGPYNSGTFTLTDDYELFAIVFQAADKQSSATNTYIDNVSFAAVPEPSLSAVLAGLAALGLVYLRRKR